MAPIPTHASATRSDVAKLHRIHADYAGDLDVDTLAGEAGMSVPAFHASFKTVTRTSPIQYLKTVRLHKARLLMVQEGVSASTAAVRVGYESASQFSREFKRFLGRPPAEEATLMKRALIVTPLKGRLGVRHGTVNAPGIRPTRCRMPLPCWRRANSTLFPYVN